MTMLGLALAWALRQPDFGSIRYSGSLHAVPKNLEAHVRFLTAPEQSRCADNPPGLDRAARYIEEAFRGAGARVTDQTYTAGGIQQRNVIADFGPDAGPRVLIGAHYDVFSDYPGADDNASGVAGILELARLLDHRPLESPVEVVAYSTEEPPHFGGDTMGSAVHAMALAKAGIPVRAMLSLEMIGYYTSKPPGVGRLLRLIYPGNGEFIALVGRWEDRDLVRQAKKCFRGATTVQAVSYSGPTGLGSDLSDQRNYWAIGVPAMMVTDTAFLRNPNYHTAGDTADTLDYRRMAGVVDGAFNTVVFLANRSPAQTRSSR
jgi:Zn-dependent M28 family amino/carboxypeptidase